MVTQSKKNFMKPLIRERIFFITWALILLWGMLTPHPTVLGVPTQKIDELLHILIFCIGVILMRALFPLKVTIIMIISLSILTEVFQGFLETRTMSLRDLIMNLLGVVSGLIIFSSWKYTKKIRL